ncbi:hypothetical protein MPH_07373 [Macrophomina phaseolina MS6]|uniref:Uncharacterized protein n=1 Tax=Macrophomina phaseolina (strain MS6) TaxID=1126212 RepID=K2RZ22_MACPH|nr:hypothetical protein MPH_07373 [Macrophomina phaseolina MS6]
MAKASRTAHRECANRPDIHTVELLADCVEVIRALMDYPGLLPKEEYMTRQLEEVLEVVELLKGFGKRVGLRWGKAHTTGERSIVGNRLADKAARRARPSQLTSAAPANSMGNGQDECTRAVEGASDPSKTSLKRKRGEYSGDNGSANDNKKVKTEP